MSLMTWSDPKLFNTHQRAPSCGLQGDFVMELLQNPFYKHLLMVFSFWGDLGVVGWVVQNGAYEGKGGVGD